MYYFDAKLAACVVYSLIITAWVFTALHFGLGLAIPNCFFWGILIGLTVGIGAFRFVKRLVAA